MSYTGISAFSIYACNESKSVLARDLGNGRKHHEKLAKRISYGCISQKKERAYAERM